MRPAAAVQALMEMRDKRQLVSLVSEDAGLLENFIMTKCEVKRSSSSGDCITIDCTFEEFRTFKVKMVENAGVFTNSKKVNKTQQKGAVNSAEKNSNVGNSTNTPSAKPKNLQTLLDENDGAMSTKDIYDQQRQAKFAKDATK